MNYDDTTHLTARIKPKQQKVRLLLQCLRFTSLKKWLDYTTCMSCSYSQVEIEVAIDTMSPNYCRSKGEQIALNVDGTSLEDSSTYSMFVTFYLMQDFHTVLSSLTKPRVLHQKHDTFLFSFPKVK